MHRIVCRIVPWLAFAVLALVVVGCGQKEFDVTGQVKYNGAIIDKPGGQVIFVAPNGSQVARPSRSEDCPVTYRAVAKVPRWPQPRCRHYPNPAASRAEPPAKPPKQDRRLS